MRARDARRSSKRRRRDRTERRTPRRPERSRAANRRRPRPRRRANDCHWWSRKRARKCPSSPPREFATEQRRCVPARLLRPALLFNNRLIVLEVLLRPFIGIGLRYRGCFPICLRIRGRRGGGMGAGPGARAAARCHGLALSRRGDCDQETVNQKRPYFPTIRHSFLPARLSRAGSALMNPPVRSVSLVCSALRAGDWPGESIEARPSTGRRRNSRGFRFRIRDRPNRARRRRHRRELPPIGTCRD